MAKEITDQSFDQDVIEASKEKPVLVDFWAVWCGPCKAMGPILDELTEVVGDTGVVAKLNVDDNPLKSGEFGIQSIPALKVFRNGEVVEELVGMQSKEALEEVINKHK